MIIKIVIIHAPLASVCLLVDILFSFFPHNEKLNMILAGLAFQHADGKKNIDGDSVLKK